MGEITQLDGTGHLLANQHTYIGDINYGITLFEEPDTTVKVTGSFQFTAEPRDVMTYPTLFIQLADSFYVGITLQQQDLQQNRYTFTGHGPLRPTLS